LACITTVMSLAVMLVEVLDQEFNFWHWLPEHSLSYSGSVLLIMFITVVFTNLGFATLMGIIHPIVSVCYPAIVVLTLCNILYKLFGFKWVKLPFTIAFVTALLFTVKAHALSQDAPVELRVTLELPAEGAQFKPDFLTLKLNQRYIISISNPHKAPAIMGFDNINTAIVTHFVNGANKIDYNSIGLPSEQIVTWSFTPTKIGRYRFYEASRNDRPDNNLVSFLDFEV
jgi:hypothetical protein